MVREQVVNPEVLAETKNQAKASQSAFEAATAAVKTKESQRLAAAAQIEKANADLAAAEAQVKVAEAEERRLAAMFAYTKITTTAITPRNRSTFQLRLILLWKSASREEGKRKGPGNP
jgi:hypothetical protein